MEKVVVVGAGVMGSGLAIHLANKGKRVNLWGTRWDRNLIKEMQDSKQHKDFQVDLPNTINLYYHNQLEEAFKGVRLVIIAVVSKGVANICRKITPYLKDDHIILSVSKGIDETSLLTMSSLIRQTLPVHLREKVDIVKLGGPIIAAELANLKYTEAVFASHNLNSAKYVGEMFKTDKFKINISTDIEGVDLCSALKNTYAIGMGMMEGLERGSNNPQAALMARGSLEMGRIVKAYGGEILTALSIAGVGDYYVTSLGGRNGQFGKYLGKGNTIERALELMEGQTVEGLAGTLNAYRLLEKLEGEGRFNIEKEAPLFNEIYKVLYEGKLASEAMADYWKR
ncbi:MAG TPA: 2-dehydropantoate 2-reductase N-terminal domain-containing protein [Tissierellaceae bacterium]|nr:2-dehydropantoate 2-reductase N-terminal domain-containing protein [Tissierellaceae bacterium]